MRLRATILAVLLLGSPAWAAEAADIEYGRVLVLENCATCHAIDRISEGTHAETPPLRVLTERYPLEALEEALAEGITTGYPDMPASPRQIAGIISYIESIGK